jgi:hypothetical protein
MQTPLSRRSERSSRRERLVVKNNLSFKPFQIEIHADWAALMRDFFGMDVTFEEVAKKAQSLESQKYHILVHGITFTVFQSDENTGDYEYLVYRNDRNTFHTSVDFWERVGVRDWVLECDNGKGVEPFPFFPNIWIKQDVEGYGYRLGTSTIESYRKARYPGDDKGLVHITTIPYSLFALRKYRHGNLQLDELSKMLEKFGWTERDPDVEDEPAGVKPSALAHKYFTVSYHYI